MVQPLKIAFGCQARVGKSSSVKYLIDKYGGIEFSFSEPLYYILNFTQEFLNLKQQKDREFLQFVGTWGQKQDPDLWVNLVLKNIRANPGRNIFVSDVRFPNELEALRKEGFLCVRIIRDCQKNDPTFGSGDRSHPSENSLTENLSVWDKVIYNNGSWEEFTSKLEGLIKLG